MKKPISWYTALLIRAGINPDTGERIVKPVKK